MVSVHHSRSGGVTLTNASLDEFRRRLIHPLRGRWLSRDPDSYVDSQNLYEYVGGMPHVHSDPTGGYAYCVSTTPAVFRANVVSSGTANGESWILGRGPWVPGISAGSSRCREDVLPGCASGKGWKCQVGLRPMYSLPVPFKGVNCGLANQHNDLDNQFYYYFHGANCPNLPAFPTPSVPKGDIVWTASADPCLEPGANCTQSVTQKLANASTSSIQANGGVSSGSSTPSLRFEVCGGSVTAMTISLTNGVGPQFVKLSLEIDFQCN